VITSVSIIREEEIHVTAADEELLGWFSFPQFSIIRGLIMILRKAVSSREIN
jgi:hypothetical protein